MKLHRKVGLIAEDEVEAQIAFTTVVAVSGVIHELQLPLQIMLSPDRRHIEVFWDEPDWPLIDARYREFRAALERRELDVLLVRKIMQILFKEGAL